jgi:ribosomal protein L22
MARIGYSIEMDPKASAKAMGAELHISPKKSRELCRAIKGMRTTAAQKYLEDVCFGNDTNRPAIIIDNRQSPDPFLSHQDSRIFDGRVRRRSDDFFGHELPDPELRE